MIGIPLQRQPLNHLLCPLLSQELAGSHWSLLRLRKSQRRCALHVICARRDDWRGWIGSARHAFHKDLEDTEHRSANKSSHFNMTENSHMPRFQQHLSVCVCVTGAESWPPGVCLKYVGGDQFGHVNMVMVKSLEPQEMTDVSVRMQSPVTPGMYQGQWRMCTATGLYYGGEGGELQLLYTWSRSTHFILNLVLLSYRNRLSGFLCIPGIFFPFESKTIFVISP